MNAHSYHAQQEAMRSELQAMADVIKARPRLFPKTKHVPHPLTLGNGRVDDDRPAYGMSCMLCGCERESYFATLCKRCAKSGVAL